MMFPGSIPVALASAWWVLIVVVVLLVVLAVVLTLLQLPELRRYMKMRSM